MAPLETYQLCPLFGRLKGALTSGAGAKRFFAGSGGFRSAPASGAWNTPGAGIAAGLEYSSTLTACFRRGVQGESVAWCCMAWLVLASPAAREDDAITLGSTTLVGSGEPSSDDAYEMPCAGEEALLCGSFSAAARAARCLLMLPFGLEPPRNWNCKPSGCAEAFRIARTRSSAAATASFCVARWAGDCDGLRKAA